MKKIILTIGILVFAFFTANSQETTKEKNPNAPEISFNKLVHDYGTIYQYSDGKCEFKYTNTGKEPLVLTTVRSSCGCTVPKWDRKPLLPGKSTVIQVKYATSRLGMINKTITVYSNAKTSPVVLRIKGKVIRKPKEMMPVKKTNKDATPVSK